MKVIELQLEPTPTPARPARSVRTVLTAGLCATLMFGPLAFGAVEPWSLFVLQGAAAALFCLWAVTHLAPGKTAIFQNAALIPLFAFAAVVGAQIAFGITVYRQASESELLAGISYAMLLIVASECMRDRDHCEAIAVTLACFAFLVACFAIFQNLTAPGLLYWRVRPRFGSWIFGPYVNHNHYAGLMELLLPFPLLLGLRRSAAAADKRALAWFAAIVVAGSVLLSQSRGGMIAIAAEFVFCALFFVNQRNRGLVYALGGLCALVVAFLALAATGNVFVRFGQIEPATRSAMTKDGFRMFLARPWLGWGLGTFPSVYPSFRSFYTNFFVNQAHNDLLQALIETGLAGFAAVVAFLALVYRAGFRGVRGWQHQPQRMLRLACLVGCTGLLVHSLMDFNLHVPANAALFFVFCGFITGMDTDGEFARQAPARRRTPGGLYS